MNVVEINNKGEGFEVRSGSGQASGFVGFRLLSNTGQGIGFFLQSQSRDRSKVRALSSSALLRCTTADTRIQLAGLHKRRFFFLSFSFWFPCLRKGAANHGD